MDTFYSVDEKYLQAVDELAYGERPMGLRLLTEIINNDPTYAKAHYQLGKIYYYEVHDYQTAGYHFKTCIDLEPTFPNAYYHYMRLLVFLNMKTQVIKVKEKALTVPGVSAASIYKVSGLFQEKNKNWAAALADYRTAFMEVTDKQQKIDIEEAIERVKSKIQQKQAYTYEVIE
ncbi:hypothetical protein GCM10023149_40530 [Mucilaginibacter gynuensis]|uniref:Tetratricopeptide repeat protein n=1 Tax=Mucilaginibacter gynuensis TaxID=1302236 RepID=A0ABP8H3I3_9SPHI